MLLAKMTAGKVPLGKPTRWSKTELVTASWAGCTYVSWSIRHHSNLFIRGGGRPGARWQHRQLITTSGAHHGRRCNLRRLGPLCVAGSCCLGAPGSLQPNLTDLAGCPGRQNHLVQYRGGHKGMSGAPLSVPHRSGLGCPDRAQWPALPAPAPCHALHQQPLPTCYSQ